MRRGDLKRAASLCRAHLRANPHEVRALVLMGAVLGQSDRPAAALPHLQRAHHLAPRNEEVLNNLGLVHVAMGQTHDARVAFESALAIAPRSAPAHFNLACLMMTTRELEKAESHYRTALDAKPDYLDAMAGLAEVLEQGGREAEASHWCDCVLQGQPQHAGANLTRASLDLRARRFDDVVRGIDDTLARGALPPTNHALALGLKAHALEASGNYAAAFDSFRAANDTLYRSIAQPASERHDRFTTVSSIERMRRFFTSKRLAKWPREPPPDAGPAPIFLLGFPRSGTTLLDRILSSHSRLVTLEERENLTDMYCEYGASNAALGRLDRLDPVTWRACRNRYWERVRDALPPGADPARRVVDRLPLNTILLGFIARFFPDAPVIFALRDPRDACLSCFQQRFEMNPANFQFLGWKTTVDYYNAVMSLGIQVLEAERLRYHVHRYEQLVREPRVAVQALIEFLDLPWEDGALDYRGTARERYTSTPSARQVVQPLYTSATERWRHYERWLQPDLARLRRWVETFGYDA